MTYDFSTRLDINGTRMQELHSNMLTYTRTGSTPITVENFTPGKTDVELLQSMGIAILNQAWQDFIFDLADLATLTPAYPKVGDQITWGTLVFEVMPIQDEAFKYVTSSRTRIRVHAKQVDVQLPD